MVVIKWRIRPADGADKGKHSFPVGERALMISVDALQNGESGLRIKYRQRVELLSPPDCATAFDIERHCRLKVSSIKSQCAETQDRPCFIPRHGLFHDPLEQGRASSICPLCFKQMAL